MCVLLSLNKWKLRTVKTIGCIVFPRGCDVLYSGEVQQIVRGVDTRSKQIYKEIYVPFEYCENTYTVDILVEGKANRGTDNSITKWR